MSMMIWLEVFLEWYGCGLCGRSNFLKEVSMYVCLGGRGGVWEWFWRCLDGKKWLGRIK